MTVRIEFLLATLVVGSLGACEGGDDDTPRCEDEPMPVLSTPIVDPTTVAFLTVPGGLGGGGSVVVGRSYVVISDEALANGARVPIVAPTAMDLVGVAHYIDPGNPSVPAQWVLDFRVSCQVKLGLAHINEVVPSIEATVGGVVGTTTVPIEVSPPIHFEEGDILGYKVFVPDYVNSFDLIFENTEVVNQFVNQARYESIDARILHETCVFPYFTPAIASAYLAKVGTHGTGPLGPGTCRSASRDVAGTLAGSWFWNEDPTIEIQDMREGNYPNTIAVIDDQGQYVAVANLGPHIQQSRTFANDPTYVLPETVTTRHCYQFGGSPGDGYADFSLLTPTSVRVVYAEHGLCPAVFDGTNGRTYYR